MFTLSPGGGLNKPTDRDQRSWVFLNYPKNTLPLTEHPKKYFPKSKTLKNTLQNTIHLAKVKHSMIIMENRDYLSTRCIKLDPKSTVKNMKHLKIQHLSNNPKKIQQLRAVPKKIQIFQIQNPKKYSADPCLYAKSTPWDTVLIH